MLLTLRAIAAAARPTPLWRATLRVLRCGWAPDRNNTHQHQHDTNTRTHHQQSQRFLLQGPRTFQRQYAQLYFCRLAALAPAARARAEAKWPGVPVVKTLGASEDRDVAVVGTLFKQMKLRPNVLDEYTKEGALKQALGLANFCDPSDSLVLEDEGARLALRCGGEGGGSGAEAGAAAAALPVASLVTGVVAAVRGRAEANGDFVVSDIAFAGLPPQPPRPAFEGDAYVALVSGLELAGGGADRLRVSEGRGAAGGGGGGGSWQGPCGAALVHSWHEAQPNPNNTTTSTTPTSNRRSCSSIS